MAFGSCGPVGTLATRFLDRGKDASTLAGGPQAMGYGDRLRNWCGLRIGRGVGGRCAGLRCVGNKTATSETIINSGLRKNGFGRGMLYMAIAGWFTMYQFEATKTENEQPSWSKDGKLRPARAEPRAGPR